MLSIIHKKRDPTMPDLSYYINLNLLCRGDDFVFPAQHTTFKIVRISKA